MKSKKSKVLAALIAGVVLCATAGVMAGCNPDEKEPGPVNPPQKTELEFTSASSTTIDQKAFTVKFTVKENKVLSVVGECTGKAQSQGGPGGPGGGFPGGPGGGQGGGQQEEEEDTTDYSTYSFTKTGSWDEKTGWGYTFTLDNETINVNYDVFTSEHYFYYAASTTIDNEVKTASSAVKYSAADSAYNKTLAADYKTYEEKNCLYHFYGGAEGAGGNLNVTDLYLLPQGVAVDLTGRDSKTYTKGTWTEDTAKHQITVTLGSSTMVTDYTNDKQDGKDKTGYRLTKSVSSMGGSSEYSIYASGTKDFEYYDFNDIDFEGTDVKTINGQSYNLVFTSKNYVKLVSGAGAVTLKTTYTVGEDGAYTFANATNFTYADGVITVNYEKAAPNPFTPATKINETYTVNEAA